MTAREAGKSKTETRQNDHVLALCHMLSNRIGKAFSRELAAHGLTAVEWRVMLTLALRDVASGQEITNRWAMDKMAVNRAIASLERKALVEKRVNTADRRNIDILLTSSGRAIYEKLLPVANNRYHTLMMCLDGSEKKALHAILSKMIGHIDRVM